MKSLKLPAISNKFLFPGFLLLLTVLTYGLFAFRQGFYLDDWYITLYQKYFGASGFIKFFQEDRPFLGYVYRIFLPIFKDSPAAWHIFAVFTRWLVTLTFWGGLNKLFPSQNKLWKWATILFLVYPGFQFHWFAIMYSQVYLLMAVYFASYIFMSKAVNQRKPWWGYALWTAAALISIVIGIVPMEYFYGMELFRPIVLYLLLRREYPRPLKAVSQALLHWLPYLAIFAGFTAFRIINSSAYSYQVGMLDLLANNPIGAIKDLVVSAVLAVYDATLKAWWNPSQLFDRDLLTPTSVAMLILMLIAGGLTWFVLSRKDSPEYNDAAASRNWIVLGSGLLLTVVALLPFLAAAFSVSLEFPSNRFLLSLAPGISIFLVGAANEFLRTEKQKIILIAALCALAVGSQFMTARGFVTKWEAQQDFFWQLTWRAPGLEPGTALVSEDLPFSQYFSGTSLTAPLNLIYSPQNDTARLNNVFLLTSSPQADAIPIYEPGKEIQYSFRYLDFSGSTDALIIFVKPANGCLRLLSPENSPEEFVYSNRYSFWHDSIPLSNLDRISVNAPTPAVPPVKYFGEGNQNQWCFYFENADLARQQQEWGKVIDFFNQANSAGFAPTNIPEWLPLMEAYLSTDQIDKAVVVSAGITAEDPTETASLCSLLIKTFSESNTSADDKGKITGMINLHQCGEN
ncbi:MAG TPA: hypothetical protein VN364_11160 [Bellilinea sp.]|nr:hypothetical protein [Bellilinea sp.]